MWVMRLLPLDTAMECSIYLQTLTLSQDQEEVNLDKCLILLQKWNPLNKITCYLWLCVCTCCWCSQKRSATERMEMSHQAHGTRVHCSWDALPQWFHGWEKKILSSFNSVRSILWLLHQKSNWKLKDRRQICPFKLWKKVGMKNGCNLKGHDDHTVFVMLLTCWKCKACLDKHYFPYVLSVHSLNH